MNRLKCHLTVSLVLWLLVSCSRPSPTAAEPARKRPEPRVRLLVLGTVQDGGSPHIACRKECCRALFKNPDKKRKVSSLGIIDEYNGKTYLLDATPDMPEQLRMLKERSGMDKEFPDGIFLTHAHIGHYTGLMYLGREASDAKGVAVYAMPRMAGFLTDNGPWSQLLTAGNIRLNPIGDSAVVQLGPRLRISAFTVPHRDEYSETAGFLIEGPRHKVLFIPDIDKWSKWERDIIEEVRKVDFAFIDATFYGQGEVQGRDMKLIPHPFVSETMDLFALQPESVRNRIHFIHLNHSNPLLNDRSDAFNEVYRRGFRIAAFGSEFNL